MPPCGSTGSTLNPGPRATSIPEVAFIDWDAVLFQNPAEFILEADGLVMFCLVVDVGD
jgi:hypothetical protein